MKKLSLLVFPLAVISLLASCDNGGGNKPGEVKFSLSSEQQTTVERDEATVYVDWTPTEHSIKFDSFTFTTQQSKVDKVTFDKESENRPMPVTITFENDITTDISGTLSFAYEDATSKTTGNSSVSVTIPKPEFDPIVTQDEFNNACTLVGVQLLQVAQRTIINSGEGGFIQDTNIKISDLVYYLSQATDREGEMYDYFIENYAKINQLGDTTCIYTFRDNNEQTDWSTPVTAEAKQYCIRPEDCNPLLIKDMTGYECNPSLTYENFELSDNKYVYTGEASYLSGDPYDAKMELTFANKKLTHCLFTVDDDNQYRFECTYKYKNIVPKWPL